MADLFGAEPPAPNLGMGGHQAGKPDTTTWLTPLPLIRALGGAESFDLDPCGMKGWPTARQSYCLPQDGLALPWHGRVWMNPPYTTGEVGKWLRRLADHGNGLALIFARTETEAFQVHVFQRAHAILFVAGRLTFCQRDGRLAKSNAGAPSVLIAYGAEEAARLEAVNVPGAYVRLRP